MSNSTVVDCGSAGQWTDLVSAPLTPSTPPYIKSEPRDDNAFRKVNLKSFKVNSIIFNLI